MSWARAPIPTRQQRESARIARMGAMAESVRLSARSSATCGGTTAGPAPKENSLVSETYRRLVRAMPCMRCGRPPQSQFCHADMGKGMGLKTDDRRGWPGCGPHDGEPGCHWYIGTSGKLPKAVRRVLEHEYAVRTRAAIVAAGNWPRNLPMWGDE
jgi:hypothetical protein